MPRFDSIRRRPVAFLIALGAALLFAGAAAFVFLDGRPPDDADLRALAGEVRAPEFKPLSQVASTDPLEVRLSHEELAKSYWASPDDAELLGSILARESMKIDAARTFIEELPRDLEPYEIHNAVIAAAETLAIEARIRAALGEPGAAVGTIIRFMVAAHEIRADGEHVFLVGSSGALMSKAADLAAWALPDLDRHQLRQVNDALRESRIPTEHSARSLAARYAVSADLLLHGNKETLAHQASLWGNDPHWTDRLVKRNTTARMLADLTREAIANLNRPVSEHSTEAEDKVDNLADDTVAGSGLSKGALSGNSGGLRIADQFGVNSYVRVQVAGECARSLVRTAVAARLHEMEHGALPASLADLVPAYLDEVPADSFDGNPLRYDRVRRLIWSVGDDFRDRGGNPVTSVRAGPERGDWWRDDEPTITIPTPPARRRMIRR